MHVTDATFEAEVVQSATPVLVDFWAEWCSPCKRVSPVVEELAAELGEKLKVVKLDTDANPAAAVRFGVASIPTLLLFRGGELQMRLVGARPKADILQQIQPHL